MKKNLFTIFTPTLAFFHPHLSPGFYFLHSMREVVYNPFIFHRSFASHIRHYSNHPWHIVDRLDPYLETVSPEDLRGFIPHGKPLKYKVYGMHSFVFSDIMTFDIDPTNFSAHYDLVLDAARCFLNSLKENTVYKCLFVGVTSDGDIKSSPDGAFYISKYSRPEYILMKVKSGVTLLAFKYKGCIKFDSYSLAYKE